MSTSQKISPAHRQGIFSDEDIGSLTERLRLFTEVFEHTAEGIMFTDRKQNILSVNRAFTMVTGYGLEEIRGKRPSLLQSGWHDAAFYRSMWDSILSDGTWDGEVWNRRKNGQIYPQWLTIIAIKDTTGSILEYASILSDISSRQQKKEHMEYLAHYDTLTDLPNRYFFEEYLKKHLFKAQRDQEKFALLFIDLDEFKDVNDNYGHQLGDLVLEKSAQRLKKLLRKSDMLARLGGDEFTLLCECPTAVHDSQTIAEKMIEELSRPLSLQGFEIQIGCSIGISIYPDDGEDIKTLLGNADIAMYRAKADPNSSHRYFATHLDREG